MHDLILFAGGAFVSGLFAWGAHVSFIRDRIRDAEVQAAAIVKHAEEKAKRIVDAAVAARLTQHNSEHPHHP